MSIGLLMSEGRKYLVVRDKSYSSEKPSPASFSNPFVASFRKRPKCSADTLGRRCDPARGNGQCAEWVKVNTGLKVNTCKCKKYRVAGSRRPKRKCGHAFY